MRSSQSCAYLSSKSSGDTIIIETIERTQVVFAVVIDKPDTVSSERHFWRPPS